MIGRNDDDVIVIMDNGFWATKYATGPWMKGLQVSMNEIWNGSFRDVDPEEAQKLLAEAREVIEGLAQPERIPPSQPASPHSPELLAEMREFRATLADKLVAALNESVMKENPPQGESGGETEPPKKASPAFEKFCAEIGPALVEGLNTATSKDEPPQTN